MPLIMWKNMLELDKLRMTMNIRCRKYAFCMRDNQEKNADTQCSISYLLLLRCAATMDRRKRLIIMLYVHCLSGILFWGQQVLFVIFLDTFLVGRSSIMAKSNYYLRHVCQSVRLSVRISATPTGFPWNLVLGTFIKLHRESSIFFLNRTIV